jgi:multiple sugar transport system permease protein
MGYAAAMGWILFVIVAILTYLLFKSSARRVYYGG